jgi:hypothetical protein
VGQKVALKGAEVGTPVLLELGGKVYDSSAAGGLADRSAFAGSLHHPTLGRRQVLHRHLDARRFVSSVLGSLSGEDKIDILLGF